jgi:hypothetical protein
MIALELGLVRAVHECCSASALAPTWRTTYRSDRAAREVTRLGNHWSVDELLAHANTAPSALSDAPARSGRTEVSA